MLSLTHDTSTLGTVYSCYLATTYTQDGTSQETAMHATACICNNLQWGKKIRQRTERKTRVRQTSHRCWYKTMAFRNYCITGRRHVRRRCGASSCVTSSGFVKADSHITCRAAKGIECVFPIWFTQCGSVWFTLAMPRPCHALTIPWPWEERHGQSMARARHGKCESDTAALCKSNGKDTFWTLSGTAWQGNGMLCVKWP